MQTVRSIVFFFFWYFVTLDNFIYVTLLLEIHIEF